MKAMASLADDASLVQRIFDHIDNETTDQSETTLRVPVEHYRSAERLALELERVFRRHPTAFCPSAALPTSGCYVARDAAGTPLLAVRGTDGQVRVFRNACRHRGTQLTSGAGCQKAFVCPYHAWTYGLDGALRHVPHEHGFPGLDKSTRGLVPVAAVERHGLVFVTQDEPHTRGVSPADLPVLITPEHRLIDTSELELPVNWKIFADAFLEGYHIRFTHRETFFPVQYDNLNVVETFGWNSRVTFPYRTIEKLRALPRAERTIDGRVLTFVYHLFPNVMIATLPEHIRIIVIEPLAVDRTRFVSYTLTTRSDSDADERTELERAKDFTNAGAAEDTAVSLAIQRGLASGANEFFEFGRFEAAVAHFHRGLDAAIGGAAR